MVIWSNLLSELFTRRADNFGECNYHELTLIEEEHTVVEVLDNESTYLSRYTINM